MKLPTGPWSPDRAHDPRIRKTDAMTPNPELSDVPDPADFVHRHIGPSPADVTQMLETVGAAGIDELIEQTVPNAIRQRVPLALGPGLSETDVLQKLRGMAEGNTIVSSLIGQGYYGTILPPVIQRN